VFSCPPNKRLEYSNQLLRTVEQVGFIENGSTVTHLVMMGNELCINATLAAASLLGPSSSMHTSGLDSLIHINNKNDTTSISFNLPHKHEGNLVVFEGIGFICENTAQNSPDGLTKEILRAYCEQYKVGAFGLIQYQANKIKPYVYVKDVDSLVAETACGSGSIATSIVTGYENIIQPTGKSILVERQSDNNQVTVSAQVTPLDT
jgi:hypothetical protein